MITKGNFSWKARARSFRYALRGLQTLICTEHNTWIHTGAALLALLLCWLLDCRPGEWIAVILCIGAVIMAEAFNTAIEALCDHVSPEINPLIGKAKDVAAAGVLIMAAAALAVGCIIFIPKILSLWF